MESHKIHVPKHQPVKSCHLRMIPSAKNPVWIHHFLDTSGGFEFLFHYKSLKSIQFVKCLFLEAAFSHMFPYLFPIFSHMFPYSPIVFLYFTIEITMFFPKIPSKSPSDRNPRNCPWRWSCSMGVNSRTWRWRRLFSWLDLTLNNAWRLAGRCFL